MPRFDGTGPRGRGPGTGRGRGGCGVFSTLCDARRPPGRIFISLAVTVAGAVVKDVMNPLGITRKILRALRSRFAGRLQEPEADAKRIMRTVDAEVLLGPRKLK